jgi:amino acid transporter
VQDLGIYGAVIFLVALLNSCGLQVLTLCTQAGGVFHLAGVLLLVLMVPLMATEHQPASWVFGHFETAQAESVGIMNYFNIAILGLLLPAYSYTGMDGPCHMSEEVQGASMHPPKAILYGWMVMFVGGAGKLGTLSVLTTPIMTIQLKIMSCQLVVLTGFDFATCHCSAWCVMHVFCCTCRACTCQTSTGLC